MALQLVFTVKASNKSALFPTEAFLKEVEAIGRDPELVDTSHFVAKVKGFHVPWINCIFVPEFEKINNHHANKAIKRVYVFEFWFTLTLHFTEHSVFHYPNDVG